MSSDDQTDLVFKALAAPVRRDLMDALKDNPQTTGELCARFDTLNRCTVMQHLGVLEEAGLVIARKQGRQRWNYLNALPIKQIHDRWIGAYASGAVDLLARMKDDMESLPVSQKA
ncbi:helix-turn-helix transcriptional regulator [Hyphomonas chukchiensis]|uniref:ArsR/SmtB family transcription factor n=1 Tax=Hyphomonas chukchiensis TaxID=1280947 RepID=UPI0030F8FD76